MSARGPILAALGPAVVFGAWAWASGALREPAPREPDEAQARMHRRYAANPRIVVVGNSQAHAAIDPDLLARRTGSSDEPVMATLGGAGGAMAYALLAHQVLPHGKPRLVLMAMNLGQLMDSAPPPDGVARTWFEALRDHPDAALDQKVYGSSWTAWRRAVEAGSEARDAGLGWLTQLPLRLVAVDDPAQRLARARVAVLGELGGAQFAASVDVMPLGARRAGRAASVGLEESLLPEMVKAAREAGVQVLFVTLPVQDPAARTDPALVRRVAAWAQEQGAGLLHLEGVVIPPDGWLDGAHMNSQGQERFTEALGRALMALGGPDHVAPPMIPWDAPTADRVGEPVALAVAAPSSLAPCVWRLPFVGDVGPSDSALYQRGLDLDGPLRVDVDGRLLTPHAALRGATDCRSAFLHASDGLWISPSAPRAPDQPALTWASVDEAPGWVVGGSGLRWRWTDAPRLPAGAELRVVAQGFGAADGPPSLRAAGEAVAFQPWGSLWLATAPLGGAEGDVEAVIETPPGLHLKVTAAVLHSSLDQWLIGSPDLPRLDVAGAASVTSAPPIAPADLATAAPVGRTLTFTLPSPHDQLDDDALTAIANDPRFRACHLFEAFSPTARLGPDRLTSRGGVVTAVIPDDVDPAGPWTLRQRPVRDCKHHTFVLPGETVTLTPRSPRALPVEADQLRLEVATLPSGRDGARVRLSVGDEVVLDAAASPSNRWALPEGVGPHPQRVSLEVTAPPDAWAVVSEGVLEAAIVPDFAWMFDHPPTPLVTLRGVLDAGRAPRLFPATTRWTPEGEGGVVAAPPGERWLVCLPDLPAAPISAVASVAAAGPPMQILHDVRWFDGEGTLLKGPAQTGYVRAAVGPDGATLALEATPAPGATAMRICLRGLAGDEPLRVRTWHVSPAP